VNEPQRASLLTHKVTGLHIPADTWRQQANGGYTAKTPDMPHELTYRHTQGGPCILLNGRWPICCRMEWGRATMRDWKDGHSPDCENQGTGPEMPS
jgi:hypothetical protein